MPNAHSPYPLEFKREAVRLVKEGSWKISEVAQELGVTGESIRNWIRQYEVDHSQRKGLTTDEKQELQKLRREVRSLKEEREILKKSNSLPQSGEQQSPVIFYLFVERQKANHSIVVYAGC